MGLVRRTNGVSFSLVAGACCIVVNSNGWSYNSSELTNSPRSLNINSTGAKYIRYIYTFLLLVI